VCLYVIIILLHDLTLLRCKTCAIDIGSLKATYLLTYLLTTILQRPRVAPYSSETFLWISDPALCGSCPLVTPYKCID